MSHSPDAPITGAAALPSVPAWADEWEVLESELIAESKCERLFRARHSATGRMVWWHQVREDVPVDDSVWSRHFAHWAQVQKDSTGPVTELLTWGWVRKNWCYVTSIPDGQFLAEWKPRRQSNATSVRMQMMLRAVQLALEVVKRSDYPLRLNAELIMASQTERSAEPVQLWVEGWLPAEGSGDVAQASLLEETEHILNHLIAGMPWPLELSRVFKDASLSGVDRLQQSEAILQTQFSLSRPTVGESLARASGVSALVKISAAAAVILLVGGLVWWSMRGRVDNAGELTPAGLATAPKTPPTAVPASFPPVPKFTDVEIEAARKTLKDAFQTGLANNTLKAADRLLEMVPDDPMALQYATNALNRVVRKIIDDPSSLTPKDLPECNAWAARGFINAKILESIRSWPNTPLDATGELRLQAEAGNVGAMLLLGQLLVSPHNSNRDENAAYAYFRRAADLGDNSGIFLTGECLKEGKGTPKDVPQAIAHFEKAAGNGDTRAMEVLGKIYYERGGADDLDKAQAYFNQALVQGNTKILPRLAVLYLEPKSRLHDPKQAMGLLLSGHEKKDAECAYLLAQCAENGIELDRDPGRARSYYEQAAAWGHKKAQAWLDEHPVIKPANKSSLP